MTDNKRIDIYDTTLRDGTQALGVSFSLADKLDLTKALDEFGVDYIEGGYPLSNPKDEQFFQEVMNLNLKNARIAAFGMTRRKDITAEEDTGMQALLNSGAPVITIVGKTWDLHVRDVLRVSEDENLAMIADSVAIMVKNDREAIYDAEHFFDGFKANSEYAIRTLKAAVEAGAHCLCLCDTNGGSTMQEIADIISALKSELGEVRLGIHCHNDSGLALANSLTAVLNGVTHVQGTINGIGERTGNADLTAIIANLLLKYGYDALLPGSLENLTDLSRFFFEKANMNIPSNQPFVGPGAFSHKGGMHVHAVQRNTSTYEHIDPEVVGNRRRILVSELSGVSNIAATVPAEFNISDDKEAQRKILERIMELENEGYEFEVAGASMNMLIRKTLGGDWYKKFWELDHYRCVIYKRGDGTSATEATVKVFIDGEPVHTVAEGDGPVDSLTTALMNALLDRYPEIRELQLNDYRVRVVNTQAGTAARVRVVIDWRDRKDGVFGSVGVSENIIEASWIAVVDAIEFKLSGVKG